MKIFEGHINGDKPVMVVFSAEWSSSAMSMESVLHDIKEKAGEKITILKKDIDKEPDFKKLYDIRTVPTLILFKQGKAIWRKEGIATTQEILAHLSLHY